MYSSKTLRARRKNFLSYNYALPKPTTGVANPTTPQRQTTTHATPREPNRSDLKAMLFKSPQLEAYLDKDPKKTQNKKKKLPGTKLLKLLEKK